VRKLESTESKNQFIRIYDKLSNWIKTGPLIYDNSSKTYLSGIQDVWNAYHGKDMSEKVTQGLYNMILSHYAETKLDDLPKGSVGYVLGRRKAFSKHIKTVLEARGMSWEREDPSKATFFL